MSVTRFPAHLTLVTGALNPRPAPLEERRVALKRGVAGVLSHDELFETIERVGLVAPEAPLSFLIVHIDGLPEMEPEEAELTTRVISGRVRSLTRAIDAVGHIRPGQLGVVLQGTGATAAGAVAARLTYHISNMLRGLRTNLTVRVSAATGTGANWDTLPVAASELPDCG